MAVDVHGQADADDHGGQVGGQGGDHDAGEANGVCQQEEQGDEEDALTADGDNQSARGPAHRLVYRGHGAG